MIFLPNGTKTLITSAGVLNQVLWIERTNQLARANVNATYLTIPHCRPPRKESSRIFQSAHVCEAKYRKRYLSLSRDYPDPNLGTKCNRNTYYLCLSLNPGHLACKSNTLPIELKGKPTGHSK